MTPFYMNKNFLVARSPSLGTACKPCITWRLQAMSSALKPSLERFLKGKITQEFVRMDCTQSSSVDPLSLCLESEAMQGGPCAPTKCGQGLEIIH